MVNTKQPREQSGRDTLARFGAQTRSAAIASLKILEGKEIDKIYCDLHDDFVVRKKKGKSFVYLFYQVKTKAPANYQWGINDLLGLKIKGNQESKDKIEGIKKSFIGKLLLHTVIFSDACECVIFQTNIHVDQNVQAMIDDIESGKYENKFSRVLLAEFNDCFSVELEADCSEIDIKGKLEKLGFDTDVQYIKLKNDEFDSYAKKSIFKYSEVELGHLEAQEILMKLLHLVTTKSSGVIDDFTPETIETEAAISIDDLLSILSISKEAYKVLVSSGDEKAIKSISIIQRSLEGVNADQAVIEFCSKCKAQWDIWAMNSRHGIQEMHFVTIKDKVRQVFEEHLTKYKSFRISSLHPYVDRLLTDLADSGLEYDLDHEILIGGFFAELVRTKSI